MHIIDADFTDPRVIDLLHVHLTKAMAQTPPESVHALDLAGLQAPEINVWTIWSDQTLLGIGALKRLSAYHGEIKSMHTAQSMRRQGVARRMLSHIIEVARAKGMSKLSLETGSSDHFLAARALYGKHGFSESAPFGDYKPDPYSTFMTLEF